MREVKAAMKTATTSQAKASIMTDARAKVRQHEMNSIGYLLNAEQFAAGKEKIAIQFELAQRYRDTGNCVEAVKFFNLVADNTEQMHLRKRAQHEAEKCQAIINKSQENAVSEQMRK